MLDIKFIRENPELIEHAAKKKHINFDVKKLLRVDDRRRELIALVDQKRAEQAHFSRKVPGTTDTQEREQIIKEMQMLKADFQKEEDELKKVIQKWQKLMLEVPNVPDVTVPEGKDDSDNVEIRTWGTPTQFDFPVKSHIDIMEQFDMVDFKRGTKVAGFRGHILKNAGAKLTFALWQYTLDFFVKKGYTPLLVPSLLNRETFVGTGYLPQSEDDLYKTQDEQYLSGTAEVASMGMFMDDEIDVTVAQKYISFSPCFRREAGSHGKDTRGLMRVHEFFKLEQIVLCEASHETSVALHEEMTMYAEELMQSLELPYHVVANCGGDLGLGQVKKYDIEAWVPSEEQYRETHSASYFHDFQTRRLNIRYRDTEGRLRFAHSLNNTAIATPRILIPLIENNQQIDGSIKVPEVLQKYVGTDVIRD
ncbi:serine--tRNA ligase [Candidatus Wolfebacteria bacterium]|nr:MAG: serine--tRNA ligase [Candidatus Wolfebacteria bacterium]